MRVTLMSGKDVGLLQNGWTSISKWKRQYPSGESDRHWKSPLNRKQAGFEFGFNLGKLPLISRKG